MNAFIPGPTYVQDGNLHRFSAILFKEGDHMFHRCSRMTPASFSYNIARMTPDSVAASASGQATASCAPLLRGHMFHRYRDRHKRKEELLRDGTRCVWAWVQPPHILTCLLRAYPSTISIPADGYDFLPYPPPDRINVYPQIKIPTFTTHQLGQHIVKNNNL